jgi:peptidoglycan/LPS O-acetylase OafA/YrhL
MARKYRESGQAHLNWRDFWRRRIHRLYPPYLIILLITMSLWIYLYASGGANIYPSRSKIWLALDFVSHVLMLHGFHPALDQGGGNAVYWTLAREEYLYLMYAGILLYWRRKFGLGKSLVLVLAFGVISFAVTAPLVPAGSPWRMTVVHSPIYLWIQWTLGMVAVEAHYGIVKLPKWCYFLALVPVWLAAGYLATFYLPTFAAAAWGMAFFTLLNYCVKRESEGQWPEWFAFRWLFSVGVISYSLYLVHAVVAAGILRITPGLTGLGPVVSTLVALGIALCCVVAGKIYYEAIEKHFLNSSSTAPAAVAERVVLLIPSEVNRESVCPVEGVSRLNISS